MGHWGKEEGEASPPLWVSRTYKELTQVPRKAQAEALAFQVSVRKEPVGVNSGRRCWDQSISPEQGAEITEAVQRFGDDAHLTQSQIYPVGTTAVPNVDPH